MKKIIVLISIFCCVFSASAQQPEWIIYEIAPRINDIVKNGDVIWCATEDGLLKYDLSNEKPEIYLPGDPDDYDHLVKVKIDNEGSIWTASQKKLFKLSGDKLVDMGIQDVGEGTISDLELDSEGKAWLLTLFTNKNNNEYCNIQFFDGSSTVVIDTNTCPHLKKNISYVDISIDKNNKIWLCMEDFILKIDKYGNWEKIEIPDSIKVGYITSIGFDNNDNLWITSVRIEYNDDFFDTFSQKISLLMYNGDSWKKIHEETSSGKIETFSFDEKDNIWFIKDNIIYKYGNIYKYDGETVSSFKTKGTSIDGFHFTAMHIDGEHLWLAADNMIVQYDENGFKEYHIFNPIGSWGITNIEVGRFANAYMVSVSNGNRSILNLNNGIWKRTASFSSSYPIRDLQISPGGYCWFSNWDGLYVIYDEEFIKITDSTISSFEIDEQSKIWTNFNGGLAKYNIKGNATWKFYNKDNSNLPAEHISSICAEPGGKKIWMTCFKKQLYSFEIIDGIPYFYYYNLPKGLICLNEKVNQFITLDTTNSGLISNFISHIAIDSLGGIWAACRKNDGSDYYRDSSIIFPSGICKYQEGNWQLYKSDLIGFPLDNINDIQFDYQNRGWIATNEGLIVFDHASKWNKLTSENSKLPDNKVRNIVADKNGNLWIITRTALSIYRKGGVILSSKEDQESLEKIKISLNPNPFSQSTTINYELPLAGYISLELFDMLGNKIATLVDGWQEAGRHNYELRISNYELNSGMYMVRMMSGEGVVTEKVIRIE